MYRQVIINNRGNALLGHNSTTCYNWERIYLWQYKQQQQQQQQQQQHQPKSTAWGCEMWDRGVLKQIHISSMICEEWKNTLDICYLTSMQWMNTSKLNKQMTCACYMAIGVGGIFPILYKMGYKRQLMPPISLILKVRGPHIAPSRLRMGTFFDTPLSHSPIFNAMWVRRRWHATLIHNPQRKLMLSVWKATDGPTWVIISTNHIEVLYNKSQWKLRRETTASSMNNYVAKLRR